MLYKVFEKFREFGQKTPTLDSFNLKAVVSAFSLNYSGIQIFKFFNLGIIDSPLIQTTDNIVYLFSLTPKI